MHENEFVYVYFGRLKSAPRPDPAEIADIAHLSLDDIGRRIARDPHAFTFWFKHYVRNHGAEIARLTEQASRLPPICPSMTAIAHLTTEGDAHARGFAHGRRFAREIADNVATYLRRFAASGLDRDEAFAEAARWRAAIAGHNLAYAEEMRGIAQGSGE